MKNKTKDKGINLKDIYTGEVTLIKEYNNDEKFPQGQFIGHNFSRKVAGLKIRKIAFVMKGNEGIVLSNKLMKKDNYVYKVINSSKAIELDVKNNTLVIDNPRPVGDVLAFAGYPSVVKKSDTKRITKILLSDEKVLNIRKHSVKLNGGIFVDFEHAERINKQAEGLYLFKINKLPTESQEIEKVYAKHFKK